MAPFAVGNEGGKLGEEVRSGQKSHVEVNVEQAAVCRARRGLKFTVPLAVGGGDRQMDVGADSKGSFLSWWGISMGNTRHQDLLPWIFNFSTNILSICPAVTVVQPAISFARTTTVL